MLLLQITVLLILICGLSNSVTASGGSEGAIDCCLATSKTPVPLRIVRTYAVQATDGGCKVDATLFITKKGKKLCAPPASEQKWVRDIIKKLGRRENTRCKKGKKHRRRGKNCKN